MAQPHHFYAAQALCENIDAAPAPSKILMRLRLLSSIYQANFSKTNKS
jgi:hypothetical protein